MFVKIPVYNCIQKYLFHVATIVLFGLFQEMTTYKGTQLSRMGHKYTY